MSADELDQAGTTGELLTEDEHRAMGLTVELWNLLCTKVIGHDVSRAGDVGDLCAYIHGIQRMVLGQAAARAYPDRYRLLGCPPPTDRS